MRTLLLLGVVAAVLGTAASLPAASALVRGNGAAKGVSAPALRIASVSRVTTAGENVKPFVVTRPQGGFYLAWTQRGEQHTAAFLARSTDGSTFGAPVRLSPEGMDLDLGAEDGAQAAVDSRGRIYVVWAAGSWAAAKTPSPLPHSSHVAHAGHGSSPLRPGNLHIYLVTSTDDGRTFSPPRRVDDGPDGPERRFPTVAADDQGAVYVVWLDKRKQSTARPDFSRAYLAKSTDGGKTFAPNVDVTGRQSDPICHCCKLAVATDPTGGLFVAFRNDVSDRRDIYLVRSADGAKSVSPPAPVEETRWMISYCPMDGPSLAADPSGDLHAVWPTGGHVKAEPMLGGKAAPFKVLYRRFVARKHAWETPFCVAGGTHPRIVVGPEGEPFIAWKGDGIMVAQLTPGKLPPALQVSAPGASGAYPSLAVGRDGVLCVAWQQQESDGSSQVYLARIERQGD